MERKYKHTPGPWFVSDKGSFKVCTLSERTGVYADKMPKDDASHDAQLIAAAPCLLEALEILLENYGDTSYCSGEDKESDPDVQQARAAIARATGETR